MRLNPLLCHQHLWNVTSARGCGFLTAATAEGQQLGGAVAATWNGFPPSWVTHCLAKRYLCLINNPEAVWPAARWNICDSGSGGYQQLQLPLVLGLTEWQLGERWPENAGVWVWGWGECQTLTQALPLSAGYEILITAITENHDCRHSITGHSYSRYARRDSRKTLAGQSHRLTDVPPLVWKLHPSQRETSVTKLFSIQPVIHLNSCHSVTRSVNKCMFLKNNSKKR